MYHDTPLMVGGVLYTVTSLGQVAAIDPGTGQTRWLFDPESWKPAGPATWASCTAGSPTGATGDEERLLLGTGDAYLLVDRCEHRSARCRASAMAGGSIFMAGVARAVRGDEFAVSAAPIVCRGVVVVGSSIHDGPTHKEWPRGDVDRLRRADGPAAVDVPVDPAEGRVRGRDLDAATRRPTPAAPTSGRTCPPTRSSGLVYLPFGTPTNDFYGGHRPGREPVRREPGRRRRAHRERGRGTSRWCITACGTTICRAAPALVDLRVEGPRGQGRRAGEQAGVHLRVRPPERAAGLAHRGAARARSPTVPGERTSPTQPFPLAGRPRSNAGPHRRRPHRLHAGAAGPGGDRSLGVRSRAALHAALRAGYRCPPGWVGGANWGGAAVDPDSGRSVVPSITHRQRAAAGEARRGEEQLPAIAAGGVTLLPTRRRTAGRQAAVQPRDRDRPEPRRDCGGRARSGTARAPCATGASRPPRTGSGRPRLAAGDANVAVRRHGAGWDRDTADRAAGRSAAQPAVPPEPPRLVAFDKSTGAWSGRPRRRAGRLHRR